MFRFYELPSALIFSFIYSLYRFSSNYQQNNKTRLDPKSERYAMQLWNEPFYVGTKIKLYIMCLTSVKHMERVHKSLRNSFNETTNTNYGRRAAVQENVIPIKENMMLSLT